MWRSDTSLCGVINGYRVLWHRLMTDYISCYLFLTSGGGSTGSVACLFVIDSDIWFSG